MKNRISKGEGEGGERGEAEGRKACSIERVVEEKTVEDLLQGKKKKKINDKEHRGKQVKK